MKWREGRKVESSMKRMLIVTQKLGTHQPLSMKQHPFLTKSASVFANRTQQDWNTNLYLAVMAGQKLMGYVKEGLFTEREMQRLNKRNKRI